MPLLFSQSVLPMVPSLPARELPRPAAAPSALSLLLLESKAAGSQAAQRWEAAGSLAAH